MALSDRLMDNLRVKLPGAIDASIKSELWNTVNDACRDAWIWRETIPVNLTEGNEIYSIAPEGTEVIYVFSVHHPTYNTRGAVFDHGQIIFQGPTPTFSDTEEPMLVQAVLAPSLDAGADTENLIPADMWSTHFDLLLDGTLGRMMGQTAKPYSNPSMAAFHLRAYKGHKAIARHSAKTGGVPGAQLWRFPRVGGWVR